jgi:uncharacterized membrane protein YuzA (DUF378 family)
MSPENRGRMIRMIIYVIVGFAAAFLYGYFKKD